MATAEHAIESQEQPLDKGLKSGALGLISSTVIATASVAPAYSIAATLVFVVGAVALQSPAVSVLAFVPMLLTSIGYSELNKADPDCGTTFTWATRAFGPKTGWAGGWAIVVADVLVMASLAQVAGQYVFLLFNAEGIGSNATSGWVLLAGIIWIVLMTAICYVGIEVSANFQKILLGIELTMLVVLSVVALVKVGTGHAPPGHLTPSISWLNPFKISSFSAFASGIILMVFIYWGWDTAVSVNEETKDKNRIPGLAAIFSTIILLFTYALVIFSMQAFAGVKTTGNGLGNTDNAGDVLSVQGNAIFGTTGFGPVFYPSAAAHGAVLGGRVHPDDDPAHRPDHAVDGRLQGAAEVVREDPSPVHDAHGVHGAHGSHLDPRLRGAELLVERHRGDRRRGDRDRPVHRVLLRPDRFRLRLVLPQEPDQQRAQPVDAGHPAGEWRADPVLPRRLERVAGLRRGDRERLHHVDGPVASTGRSAAPS